MNVDHARYVAQAADCLADMIRIDQIRAENRAQWLEAELAKTRAEIAHHAEIAATLKSVVDERNRVIEANATAAADHARASKATIEDCL